MQWIDYLWLLMFLNRIGMKTICVFCGSSMGIRPGYREGAEELGGTLLKRKIQLIYGGANVGLMRVLADTVLAGGGEVIGIMLRRLVENEVAHQGLTKMYIVERMSDRKNLMVELSDAFIAMPGGFGTFDELAEVITHNQLRLSDKPIGILNLEHYFDKLLDFFSHTAREGFLRHEHRNNLVVDSNPAELLRKMEQYQPVSIEKWIMDIKEESK
jgi:uncharacterized protein (TIGR00730 family)